jgi:HK97 family phage portal protein
MSQMESVVNIVRDIFGAMGIRWTNSEESQYGREISPEQALKNPAVWYAVNKIAGTLGQLPLNLHQTVGDRIEKPTDHWAYELFRVAPNAYQTPMVYKRLICSHALLWGNGYAYIRRVGRRVTELIPLMPDRMSVGIVDGEKVFAYVPNRDGNERVSLWESIEQGEDYILFENDEIFHLQGLGSDGLCGYSLLTLAREAWESGNKATTRTLSQMSKGYAGGVVLEVPEGQLRDETKAKELLYGWRKDHDGSDNAGKTAMLREGIKANVLSMSNKDAEFVEQMVFMRQQEALRFLLESILGDDASVSYGSAEAKNLAYLQNCLAPWFRAYEEETELKILGRRMLAQGYYVKIAEGPLLRSDKKTTADIIGQLIANRVISPNEGREMIDMNPYEGGDTYANPAIDQVETNSDTETETETSTDDALQNRAVQARVKHLIGVEANRISQSIGKVKHVAAWLDNFYSKKWEPQFADAIEELGLDRDLATQHCAESKRQLLAVCQQTEQGQVAEAIKAQVSDWKSRKLGECHVQL